MPDNRPTWYFRALNHPWHPDCHGAVYHWRKLAKLADSGNHDETVSVEELALSNAYQLEDMINVLERKGILTKKEVLDELEVIAATKWNGNNV